ncbi:MAG: DUF262 domain-containing protein [Elusimicrobia bacterium]|nr:DUF262 domain-containing protein [Elusimicrobiota bacterium]
MDITLKEITIKEVVKGYKNNDESGVVGYNGKLNVRPPYQREFVYKEKERNEVINSINSDFPLNVMYWIVKDNGTYELLDGQQRTISICEYVVGNYFVNQKAFHNLTDTEQNKILNYKLLIYFCKGNDKEIQDWFKIINIAGEKLTNQELRNAIYTGQWLIDAKKHFSKTGCPAYKIAEKYMVGSPIRQEYLETVISWIISSRKEDDIREYMGKHQQDKDANELWQYFQSVIDWITRLFPKYRKEMKSIEWGFLYNKYKDNKYNSNDLEKEIQKLMEDDDVTSRTGIYEYLFDRKEKHLNIRKFSDNMKRKIYEKQKGKCKICKKHFEIEEMEADHIKPWVEGGKTIIENCQMLCKQCNREKSSK